METPIVGGRAHHRGVSFYGKNYVVTAIRSGSEIVTKARRRRKIRNQGLIEKIPLLRGIFRLVQMLWLAGWLGKLCLLYFLFWICFGSWQVGAENLWSDYKAWILTVLFLLWIRFTPLGQYHGAEHKVYNALKEGKELNLEYVQKASRVARNCGTNLVVIFLFNYFFLSWFLPVKLAYLFGFSIAWEIFHSNTKRWTLPFIVMGNQVQRYIVTVEPSHQQLEVAIESMKKLIELEQKRDG